MAEWRWIDHEDGTHTLVEGPSPLPVARAILKCGGISARDQDRIAALPYLEWVAEGVLVALRYPRGSEAQVRCLEEVGDDATHALAKARGEVADG